MIIGIIQARMGSSRLPGKVLMEIDGEPLLKIQLERIKQSKLLDNIVVATTTQDDDNVIAEFVNSSGYKVFRGSELDVLGRYYHCAKQNNATTIVRLTADCPLVDPLIIDQVIEKFIHDKVDYCGNTVPPEFSSFPDGSDVEVFSFEALARAYAEVNDPHFREHVTFQFWRNSDYSNSQLSHEENWSKYRYTVDYPEDFIVIQHIIRNIHSRGIAGSTREIIDYLESDPDIKEINAQYFFGQGWEK